MLSFLLIFRSIGSSGEEYPPPEFVRDLCSRILDPQGISRFALERIGVNVPRGVVTLFGSAVEIHLNTVGASVGSIGSDRTILRVSGTILRVSSCGAAMRGVVNFFEAAIATNLRNSDTASIRRNGDGNRPEVVRNIDFDIGISRFGIAMISVNRLTGVVKLLGIETVISDSVGTSGHGVLTSTDFSLAAVEESGVPENLSQEGSPEIVIQVDNESGSRGGRSNVQRSFLQNHISLPEFMVMLEAFLITLISVLTLKWPREDRKDAQLRANFLLLSSILLLCTHTAKIVVDRIEDHANILFYKHLFNGKRALYIPGISHLIGFIVIICLIASSTVNLLVENQETAYSLCVNSLILSWIYAILQAYRTKKDIAILHRVSPNQVRAERQTRCHCVPPIKRLHCYVKDPDVDTATLLNLPVYQLL
ncbi:hypothetical protein ACET3Z_001367 [Daucus carota]